MRMMVGTDVLNELQCLQGNVKRDRERSRRTAVLIDSQTCQHLGMAMTELGLDAPAEFYQ